MELKDLIGKHLLDAVDFSTEQIKTWDDQFEDCQACRFRLDGLVYVVVEDPEDGYRSSCRDIITDAAATMKNTFSPVQVIARHNTKDEYEINDIIELVDEKTGEVVLEVGTANTDDYYPYFVARFHPEAMIINK